MNTKHIDLYAPTSSNPYWNLVSRETEGGWGHSSEPLRDRRNGLTGERCTLTQDEALAIVRASHPAATIVVRGEATRSTDYVCPELARSEPAAAEPDDRVCEWCGRVESLDSTKIALGMTDLYFCQPGYGCSSVDERGRDRLARGREILSTHAEGRRS